MTPSVNILTPNAASHLADFKRAVASAVPGVEKLILFGSQARGQMRDDSDYDVAVMVRDETALPSPADARGALQAAIAFPTISAERFDFGTPLVTRL